MSAQSNEPQSSAQPVTISDIEQTVQDGLEALRNAPLSQQITSALKFLIPPGYRPIAQLEEEGRKKRSNAAASNWNPETCEILIYFERCTSDLVQPVKRVAALVSESRADLVQQDVDSSTSGLDFESRLRRIRSQRGLSNEPPSLVSKPQKDASARPMAVVADTQIQQCCEVLADAEKAGKSFIALKWFRDNALTERGYAWADSLSERQAVLAKAIEAGALLTSTIPNPKAPQHPTTTVKLNRESKYAQSVAPRFQPIRAKDGASASEILLRDRGRL